MENPQTYKIYARMNIMFSFFFLRYHPSRIAWRLRCQLPHTNCYFFIQNRKIDFKAAILIKFVKETSFSLTLSSLSLSLFHFLIRSFVRLLVLFCYFHQHTELEQIHCDHPHFSSTIDVIRIRRLNEKSERAIERERERESWKFITQKLRIAWQMKE